MHELGPLRFDCLTSEIHIKIDDFTLSHWLQCLQDPSNNSQVQVVA